MHFYDKNINDDSQTITEDRFLWQNFPLCHRLVVTIHQPSLAMMKSDIVTETIHEFLEGKSIDYIIMWLSRTTKLSHYHYSVDTTVHTSWKYKFTRYYNTW
jgi:hypothetical protein